LLSIVIVNYNVKYFLEQCLYAVERAIEGLDAEVIVVDNNSADESVAYLQKKFPWVRFIANKVNTGYAKANNQGWKASAGRYILFLNPDTLVSEDSLRLSVQAMEANSLRGALGIHMVDGSGAFLPESKRGFPSPLTSLYKLSGLIRLFPRSKIIARYYQGHLPVKQDNDVEVLAGAYLMVTKKILEQTGGFDEDFFMYGEDIDLSYRIKQLGYQNYYLAGSSIIHFKGESTRKNFAYTRLFYKAMGIFVEKHYRQQAGWFTLLIKAAIGVSGALSYLRQRLFGKRPETLSAPCGSTIVVGAAGETAGAINILRRQAVQHTIITADDIPALDKALQLHRNAGIVFCAGSISYKSIINCIENLGHEVSYTFHAAGSDSIVGSMSKHNSGETIAVNGGQ
jgi:N-acetylglucosaminyl-diphospho-decaprenol L-rhamnosyltransferase